jgi:hypothetical protein
MAIWYVLWPFGTFLGHLVQFMVIWYIFSHFGMLNQEKSGNPGCSFGRQKLQPKFPSSVLAPNFKALLCSPRLLSAKVF